MINYVRNERDRDKGSLSTKVFYAYYVSKQKARE